MEIADFVRGKNVIIVGPSVNVLADCEGIDVDSYDVVVRINHHYARTTDEERDVIGKRTDMIYHCLHGALVNDQDVAYWRDNNIKIITKYPWDKRDPSKYDHDEFYPIDSSFIDDLKQKINCNPNTGVVALLHLFSLPIGTLTVVGFDFFQTIYLHKDRYTGDRRATESYRLAMKSGKIGEEDGYYHDPDLQFDYIKKMFQENQRFIQRFIPIGKLKQMLESDDG